MASLEITTRDEVCLVGKSITPQMGESSRYRVREECPPYLRIYLESHRYRGVCMDLPGVLGTKESLDAQCQTSAFRFFSSFQNYVHVLCASACVCRFICTHKMDALG